MRILLLVITISLSLHAKEIICNHPKICIFITKSLQEKDITDIKVVFSQDSQKIKKTDFFVSPPHYLDPETSKLVKDREDNSKRTFRIFLPSNITKNYKLASSNPVEELSNFWFYPDVNCFIKNEFYKTLSHFKKKIETLDCSNEFKKVQALKMKLAKLRPLNIESDLKALRPLFKMKGINFNNSKDNAKTMYIGSGKLMADYIINTAVVDEFDLFKILNQRLERWAKKDQ